MEKILTAFGFTDIHNQQSMLDYPATVRKSLVMANELATAEFGLADLALVGGDNVSDYPYWNKSCALPKKNFLDLKEKMHACISSGVKGGKELLHDFETEDEYYAEIRGTVEYKKIINILKS